MWHSLKLNVEPLKTKDSKPYYNPYISAPTFLSLFSSTYLLCHIVTYYLNDNWDVTGKDKTVLWTFSEYAQYNFMSMFIVNWNEIWKLNYSIFLGIS